MAIKQVNYIGDCCRAHNLWLLITESDCPDSISPSWDLATESVRTIRVHITDRACEITPERSVIMSDHQKTTPSTNLFWMKPAALSTTGWPASVSSWRSRLCLAERKSCLRDQHVALDMHGGISIHLGLDWCRCLHWKSCAFQKLLWFLVYSFSVVYLAYHIPGIFPPKKTNKRSLSRARYQRKLDLESIATVV